MQAPRVRFEDVWAAFMYDPVVRDWLFNRSPLNNDQAYHCIISNNQNSSLSFSFDHQVANIDNLHDFGILSTVLYHHKGVALGVTFGHRSRHPLLGIVHQFTGDPDYADDAVIVRRCAIRRASPRSRHLLRLQLDWLRSGALGVDFSFIPATSDVNHTVGFALFGHRFFNATHANALHLAHISPPPKFIDGESELLAPHNGFVQLDGCDELYQTPCIFCSYRNHVVCHCPGPLRRRTIDEPSLLDISCRDLCTNANDESPESVNEMVWRYFSHRMKLSLTKGTFYTNWRYVCPAMPHMSTVKLAHITSYALLFNSTANRSPIIQRALLAFGLGYRTPLSPATQWSSGQLSAHIEANMLDDIVHTPTYPEAIEAAASVTSFLGRPSDSCDSIPTIDVATSAATAPLPVARTKQENPIFNPPHYQPMETLATLASSFDLRIDNLHSSPINDPLPSPPSPPRTCVVVGSSSGLAGMRGGLASSVGSNEGLRLMNGGEIVRRTPLRRTENGGRGGGGGRGRATNGAVQKKMPRKWKCEQCSAIISGKRSNLNRHIANKHDKERPFGCNVCKKRFQTRLNLERHNRLVHIGRPFSCQHCRRAFKTEDKLNRHLETVHALGTTPFACNHCGGCYGKQSTLSRHIASVHRDQLTNGAPAGAQEPLA